MHLLSIYYDLQMCVCGGISVDKIETIVLVQGIKRGDKKAFEQLFLAYKDSVYFSAIMYLRNEEAAKDIVQEVFVIIYEKLNTLRDEGSFYSWMKRITYNCCMQYIRKNANNIDLPGELDIDSFASDKDKSIEEIVQDNEMINIITQEIHELKPQLQKVGVLRFFDELSIDEIANVLEIPSGTVKSRINTIRKILKERLIDRGISPKVW